MLIAPRRPSCALRDLSRGESRRVAAGSAIGHHLVAPGTLSRGISRSNVRVQQRGKRSAQVNRILLARAPPASMTLGTMHNTLPCVARLCPSPTSPPSRPVRSSVDASVAHHAPRCHRESRFSPSYWTARPPMGPPPYGSEVAPSLDLSYYVRGTNSVRYVE